LLAGVDDAHLLAGGAHVHPALKDVELSVVFALQHTEVSAQGLQAAVFGVYQEGPAGVLGRINQHFAKAQVQQALQGIEAYIQRAQGVEPYMTAIGQHGIAGLAAAGGVVGAPAAHQPGQGGVAPSAPRQG